ncbi:Pyruvate kinase [Pseudomonas sp. 8 R 14]|uniref:pyruvate kinase n=1 Tax=Pseudomonas sp. CFBP13509 TaxID=2184008 RepID=UPI000811E3AA|nr:MULTISPECIES: pyruvate kinase [unclassified Pseudomonas]CRM04529.1 Pyruvate kinase [Pseudomonas sp. 8 R 14]SAM32134.1 Pyruvate kinase [Pseudomonas sp. 1 R 17]
MTPDKKVKILATLGPATDGIDDIRELVQAGVNIFRLNFSHGEHADHARRYHWIRQVDEVCSTALEIAQAQGMAQRGQTGSTNSLRIETLI